MSAAAYADAFLSFALFSLIALYKRSSASSSFYKRPSFSFFSSFRASLWSTLSRLSLASRSSTRSMSLSFSFYAITHYLQGYSRFSVILASMCDASLPFFFSSAFNCSFYWFKVSTRLTCVCNSALCSCCSLSISFFNSEFLELSSLLALWIFSAF